MRRTILFVVLLPLYVIFSASADSLHIQGTFFRGDHSLSDPFEFEVANTSSLRELGLMYRRSLAENTGMIFVYPNEEPRSFWMKNTYIALDMLFLGKTFNVQGLLEDVPPLTTVPRSVPGIESKFVVELKAGEAKRLHLQNGDVLKLNTQLPEAEDGP